MEAKIIGLTASTITFNEIEMRSGNKLILHGKEEALVNLDTAVKLNEIAVLERCKLIKCIEVGAEEVKKDAQPKTDLPEQPEVKEPEVKDEDEEIEDAPKSKNKRGRGRPKGAKNKGTIKRVDKQPDPPEKKEDNSRAIVVNENGNPVESKIITDDIKAPEESEATRASIEAMEELEKEEKEAKEKEKTPVDETSMEANAQMGRTATVYTGEGAAKVDMRNSFIPESEVAKNADPFIDPTGDSKKADDDTDAFLDDIKEDPADDAFIEM